jgi:hypothetical protein
MLAQRLIRTAIFFLVVGVAMGIYMGAAHDFRLRHVHVHVNLLGWVALAFVGLLYNAYPWLQRGRLPHVHYWLHVLGLMTFMGGYAVRVLTGDEATAAEAAIASGACCVGLATVLLAINAFSQPLTYRSKQGPGAVMNAGSLSTHGSERAPI